MSGNQKVLTQTRRGRRLLHALLAVLVLSLALASEASASFLYWANDGATSTTVGRSNIDGTGVNQSFITGGNIPCFVTVDAKHVYWANLGSSTIGRANLDGTGVNQSFITGAIDPCGVAVDANHIYWANGNNGPGNSIGRANLDGTGVDQNFITGTNFPCGIAVNATNIYWGNYGTASGTTIGRANLDGTGVDQSFIGGGSGPCGVAVDANHVYWGNFGSTTVGRANLDGTGVNQSFITGAENPCGVAVDVLPKNTKITSRKIKKKKRTARFSFTADNATGFECALVKPKKKGKHHKKPKVKFSSCSSPKGYKKLGHGKYTFKVRGINSAGVDPNPAITKFKF